MCAYRIMKGSFKNPLQLSTDHLKLSGNPWNAGFNLQIIIKMDPEKQITCLKFFSFMNTDHNILIVYETSGNITFLYSEREY